MKILTSSQEPIWAQTFNGYYWWQMPGSDHDMQKVNFALYRRGKLKIEEAKQEEQQADGTGLRMRTPSLVSVHTGRSGHEYRSRPRRSRPVVPPLSARRPVQHRTPISESPEQKALKVQYRRIAEELTCAGRPRETLRRLCVREGMAKHRVVDGLDKRRHWTPSEIAIVGKGIVELEFMLNRLDEHRQRIQQLWDAWLSLNLRGAKKKLMQASKVSWQTVTAFGKKPRSVVCAATLARLEAGLRKCLASQNAQSEL
jgi:hypothetical protein